MGTPTFAVPILKALLEGEDKVIAVVTQPDKPAGRGKKLSSPPVKILAREYGLPVLQPEKLKESDFLDKLQKLTPDIIVVAAYGKILPKEVLEIPLHGCINVHASLLPKFRGAAPINWAIMCGEKQTGVTIIQMDEGMDTGDILLMKAIPIKPDETAGELHDRLSRLGAKLVIKALKGLKEGKIRPKKQPREGISYAPMLRKEDGLLDFLQPADELARLIRGLDPWPSAYAYFRGKLIKFFRPKVINQKVQAVPGEIVKADKNGLLIATSKGLLLIEEVQIEGKKRIPVAEFIKGWHPTPGERLQGR